MNEIYFVIVGFLLILAVFDLFVGVSNDAVNFLNSAIGAKVARFRTVLIVAGIGVLIGAVMSAGMMDVARHGIMRPSQYSFEEVMCIFLAVMVTDVIVLDVFNTLGMPTSTTVSLVFELLGASFVMALLKMGGDGTLGLSDLLNSEKALSVIIAIFVSVAIAFVTGLVVQWITRLVLSFNYKKNLKWTIGLFGGIAFTSLAYFIFIKGVGGSPFVSEAVSGWIKSNTTVLLAAFFVVSAILSHILNLLKADVFKIIILLGTFSLAMAFAGNDLVNFIGVPLAALDSLKDFVSNGSGDASTFMMTSLESSAKSPLLYLLLAGIIMVMAMFTSKKAQNVVKTSVNLCRQDESDEMFGSSSMARMMVRTSQNITSAIRQFVPESAQRWVGSRFRKEEAILKEGAAFDEVRASVNLVLSALLIIMGTTLKLPLSTTYVTFMVAMGSSLADKAWSRETAVFRITGVISVIGGWFLTAGIAFAVAAVVCLIMHFGGFIAMIGLMLLAVYILYHSKKLYDRKQAKAENSVEQKMLTTNDTNELWTLLEGHFVDSQVECVEHISDYYESVFKGLVTENIRKLHRCDRELKAYRNSQKQTRRLELVALRRADPDKAIGRTTWFHLAMNWDQQATYCLRRMLDPVVEHVDNCFSPLSSRDVDEYRPEMDNVLKLLERSKTMMRSGNYDGYKELSVEFRRAASRLSDLRKAEINRMQSDNEINLKTSQLYLNLLQETEEMLNIARRQLRAVKHFIG